MATGGGGTLSPVEGGKPEASRPPSGKPSGEGQVKVAHSTDNLRSGISASQSSQEAHVRPSTTDGRKPFIPTSDVRDKASRRVRTSSSSSTGETAASRKDAADSGSHEADGGPEVDAGRKEYVGHRRQDSRVDPNAPPRLLVVSSKIKNSMIMQTAVLPNVTFIQYKYESATLEGLLASISQHLGNKRVECMAFIFHSTSNVMYVTGRDDKVISRESVVEQESLRNFLCTLVEEHLDRGKANTRIDILACATALAVDGAIIGREISTLVGLPIGISKDITGADIPYDRIGEDSSKVTCIGELFFRLDRVRSINGTHNQQSLAGFEKIRTVGKGAYGTAVLYRKKDDDSLVILKEINLHDLNASERQLALNEVRVLAMLDHPNIISYYDSFEEDGIIMIEMEYADGGTLAQLLSKKDKALEEREILSLFGQIVSAIKYIHEHNILHRDLKTANIFLTKEERVKVGDFGISKLMSTTNQAANTVLGTPYYISPEMCEGKPYNDKSDIWALGCILYEMACLQKTFEGSNLPALVNKIMKGQFAPVKGSYSQEFKKLIMDMLQREPEYRPSACEVWNGRMPDLTCNYDDDPEDLDDPDELMTSSENALSCKKKARSVLYYLEMANMHLEPVKLPPRIKIREVAVGANHVIAVTMERMVYTWGEGHLGQLGHGDLDSKSAPTVVEALKGKSIVRACCGDGFSVYGSDNGIVMTCGDGALGCLGHGDWCSTARPRLIEALLSVDVVSLACGQQHVCAVGCDSEVFTWGCGSDGRLGTGYESNQCQPVEVTLAETVCVRECRCGTDGTMLLTDVGSVLACGSNEHNKLGLNQRVGFLMAMKNIFNKTEVAGEKEFLVVRALARHQVVDVCMGPHHSSVIIDSGYVYTFGRNTEGQLGNGNTKPQNAPIQVKVLDSKLVSSVQCGEFYTIASSTTNDLLIWGTRFKKPPAGGSTQDIRVESAFSMRGHSRQPSTTSVSSVSSVKESSGELSRAEGGLPEPSLSKASPARVNPETGEGSKTAGALRPADRQISTESVFGSSPDPRASSFGSADSGGFRPISSAPRRTPSASSNKDKDAAKDESEIFLQPTPLLQMDSDGSRSDSGDTVTLSRFYCHGENLFVQVETTAAPPRRLRSRRKRKRFSNSLEVPEQPMSASSRDGGDEYSSEASELDTYSTRMSLRQKLMQGDLSLHSQSSTQASIPAWLKQELEHSIQNPTSEGNDPDNDADDTSDHSDAESAPIPRDSSMSSIQINKHLKPAAAKPSTDKTQPPASHTSDYTKGEYQKQKSSSVESGVELTAEVLSSSSSSSSSSCDNLHQSSVSPKESSKAAVSSTQKKAGPGIGAGPKRAAAPTPLPKRSSAGPAQSQKPLTRLRAQGKTRRSDPKEVISARSSTDGESKQKQEALSQLQKEMERLRQENAEKAARLEHLESEHRTRQQQLEQQVMSAASQRERQLQGEISALRGDLQQQNHMMHSNYALVQTLQEQLTKVQSEQVRLSQQDARLSTRQPQKESRICVLQ